MLTLLISKYTRNIFYTLRLSTARIEMAVGKSVVTSKNVGKELFNLI